MKRQIRVTLWNCTSGAEIDLTYQEEREFWADFAKKMPAMGLSSHIARESPMSVQRATDYLSEMVESRFGWVNAESMRVYQYSIYDMRALICRLGGVVHVKDVD